MRILGEAEGFGFKANKIAEIFVSMIGSYQRSNNLMIKRMNNKRIGVVSLLAAYGALYSVGVWAISSGRVEFSGSSREVLEYDAEKSTGLDAIFVIYDINDISDIKVNGNFGTEIAVMKYSNLGGGYGISLPYERIDGGIRFVAEKEDMGYIISDNGVNYSFWCVDYLPKRFSVNALSAGPDQSCDYSVLEFSGSATPIYYYTIDGRRRTLSRDINITYNTLEWNEENEDYSNVEINKEYEYLDTQVSILPPFYCATKVNIKGDRFLKAWNQELSFESSEMAPNGVEVQSIATQTNVTDSEEASNMIKQESTGLGGSAPADISFQGFVTDAVMHTEWQMASDSAFDYILYRWNEKDVEYTFMEEGDYYVRFIGSNADGSCESIGETYQISIGASDLRIPNAFSPDGDGVNDIWKVGYRSLVEFKCWIFDSRGTQLYHFTDPQSGWDGTYRGKKVGPGVYYYIIEAKGSDGKKYKKGGDINIIGYRKLGTNNNE